MLLAPWPVHCHSHHLSLLCPFPAGTRAYLLLGGALASLGRLCARKVRGVANRGSEQSPLRLSRRDEFAILRAVVLCCSGATSRIPASRALRWQDRIKVWPGQGVSDDEHRDRPTGTNPHLLRGKACRGDCTFVDRASCIMQGPWEADCCHHRGARGRLRSHSRASHLQSTHCDGHIDAAASELPFRPARLRRRCRRRRPPTPRRPLADPASLRCCSCNRSWMAGPRSNPAGWRAWWRASGAAGRASSWVW